MNPKQALGTDSAASCGALDPPLRGIVQLTNSAMSHMTSRNPTVTFRLFGLLGYYAFGIGVSQ